MKNSIKVFKLSSPEIKLIFESLSLDDGCISWAHNTGLSLPGAKHHSGHQMLLTQLPPFGLNLKRFKRNSNMFFGIETCKILSRNIIKQLYLKNPLNFISVLKIVQNFFIALFVGLILGKVTKQFFFSFIKKNKV